MPSFNHCNARTGITLLKTAFNGFVATLRPDHPATFLGAATGTLYEV